MSKICIDDVQEAYNKRMKKRKDRSRHLLGEMRAISFNKKKEIKPTAKRSRDIKWGFYLCPTAKTPRLYNQLNFKRS